MPDFLSGKSEVCQFTSCKRTSIGTLPNPRVFPCARSSISSAASRGRLMKCHGESPFHSYTVAVNVSRRDTVTDPAD